MVLAEVSCVRNRPNILILILNNECQIHGSLFVFTCSISLHTGSRIECVARAINAEGDPGLELSSNAVTISSKEAVCLPRVEGSLGAEPFSAKMKYTGECMLIC